MKSNLLSCFLAPLIAICALTATNLQAQISITPGATVSENFASLGTNAVATLPSGWKVDKNTNTVRAVGSYASAVTATERVGGANMSTTATGGIYNFGSSATDRAVGGLGSSSIRSVNVYAALQNTGSSPVPSFAISYNAERFRNGSNTNGFSVQLYYSTDGTNWTSAGTNFLSSFTPNTDNAGAAVVPIQTISVSSQTLPVALSAGSTLYLAWNYSVTSGTSASSAQAIGVSDISITAASVTPGAPVITSPLTATAVAFASSANIYQIIASGSPTSYGATGLPAGLSIDSATGVISGQPTVAPGTYPVVISATNALGTGQENLALTITKNPGAPTITSSLAVTTPANSPFSYQIEASNAPTTYAAANLPTGLTVDTATGLITGTPTTGGVRNISITASNSLGSDTQTLVLTISTAPVITSSLSGSLYTTDSFSYTVTATGTPTPTLDASGLPSGWTITNGVISNNGTPLTTGTISFQISASNAVGTDTETYTLAVFDQTTQNAIPLNVVVNKYSNATPDRVQLLVVGNGTPGSTVDMRGMIIKDFSSSNASDSGGKYIFSQDALWSAVPTGTLIALSAGTTQTEDIDHVDYFLAVNLGNVTYFTSGGGSFDIATTDMLMIKTAGSGVSGVAGGIHALGTAGTTPGAQFAAFLGAKLRTQQTSGTDQGLFANNTTSALLDYGVSGQAASVDATGSVAITAPSMDFASWNNASNQTYILSLRGAGPATPTVNVTGSAFNAFSTTAGTPSAAQTVSVSGSNLTGAITITPPTGFEVSSDGTTFSSSVSLTPVSGSVAATTISVRLSGASAGSFSGDVSFASTGATTQTRAVSGTVTSAYDAWAASYSLTGASALPTADPDNDGLNNNNEYAFGTNPNVANAALMTATTTSGNMTVSWIERNSGLTYAVQSTINLATTAFATDGTVTVVAGPTDPAPPAGYTRKQFTVPASNNKFFRIRATAN